jgi:formylglycine-generating enzyme required for sulfatase activity
MTWNEAVKYCEKLSAKTGLKANLPTETQWEWACRAGSNSDFWYGNFNTNFAQFENLADKQLNKLAVSGVNPQPMPETWEWYKYYTFQPKDNTVDDGSFLTVKGAGYKANAFGLYDMQGNVSEWTRSDYVPYPLNPKKPVSATEKVVRGGSWEDAPKTSTAYFRKSYYPWQSVHNVGFRVILED